VAASIADPRAGLTQQELESRLWAAANSLRGPVDPADFKAYIFPLLFYKRVCDTWDDEHVKAKAEYNDDLTPEIEADYHRFQVPAGAHWRDLRRVDENVGVALRNSLDRIQQANPDTLSASARFRRGTPFRCLSLFGAGSFSLLPHSTSPKMPAMATQPSASIG